jgi:hypothetical protein
LVKGGTTPKVRNQAALKVQDVVGTQSDALTDLLSKGVGWPFTDDVLIRKVA